MSEHRIIIVVCEDKTDSNKTNYIALSSETPHLSEDALQNMGYRFIKYQKSEYKIRWTIFGPLRFVIVTDCSLPLSDRLNDIILWKRRIPCECESNPTIYSGPAYS